MTTLTWALLAAFLVIAAADWTAVGRGLTRLRYVTKPGCMLPLIAAATLIDPVDGRAQVALVVALALSLAGDVFLLLPGRAPGTPGPNLFVAGLGSFLMAHIAYVVGFLLIGVRVGGLVVGMVGVLVIVGVVGRRVLGAVRSGEEPEMAMPVGAYIAVISAMVLVAFGTLDPRAVVGAVLFALSDSIIAWERFVHPRPWGPVVIIVTYHIAQALLLLSFT